ncbi:hypothetical protein SVAN01_09266 [Stagonosporopsis vannaccii]|nr:hypothetical protein SVAN01_09266 [Stagonosporopsis vannaccii]
MSCAQLLARAAYGDNSSRQRTGLIVAILCGIFAVILFAAIWICRCRSQQGLAQRDTEAQRAEQRRVYGGWYGQETHRETAVERRSRMAREAGASRGCDGGIEREARREREAREGEPAPPTYQLPGPTYHTMLETRRQRLTGNRPLPNPEHDAPPAYDSPMVWPIRG